MNNFSVIAGRDINTGVSRSVSMSGNRINVTSVEGVDLGKLPSRPISDQFILVGREQGTNLLRVIETTSSRFDLDGSTQSNEWMTYGDSHGANVDIYRSKHIHHVFEDVSSGSHTVRV